MDKPTPPDLLTARMSSSEYVLLGVWGQEMAAWGAAQERQHRDPQTIVTLALAYAATRAHDEGRTIGELRKAACILFGAEMVDAAIDKARGK